MRLLLDMNLSPSWVAVLSESGHDTEHWSNIGPGDASDQEVLAYAAQQDRVLLTHDLDFGAILAATGRSRPSVLQIRSHDIDPATSGRSILEAIDWFQAELVQGALVSLDVKGGRARLLPIEKGPR
ncbi:MAG: DUF5615 family PIN-like protein [Fimbriimonadaceae bacterium]|nr:DUF5615 family PIN-like protein [Fimbriimonadaceae bacterium]